uniref:Synphilin-1 n=1 Tax=Daphnia magna TaxID=35525 RepID=A0A0N8DY86_9CRUS
MKPHVRYGHTPHSTAGGGGGAGSSVAAGRSHQLYRRPGGGDDDDSSMIEEYKLEEQLAPFYETTSSSLSERNERTSSSAQQQSARCFLPSASQSPGKPALRTISIMETLSELTSSQSARASGADAGSSTTATSRIRRPPEETSSSSSSGGTQSKPHPGTSHASVTAQQIGIQRRMKKGDNNNGNPMVAMASLLDIPQWYPTTKGRVASGRTDAGGPSVSSERVWDVSHFAIGRPSTNKHQGNNNNLTAHRNKARSVQDMLLLHSPSKSIQSHKNNVTSSASGVVVSSATSAHGYGSLERRRRRRPGARAGTAGFGVGVSARRGETDWEREADEEDDDEEHVRVYGGGLGVDGRHDTEPMYPMQSAVPLFRQQPSKNHGRNNKNNPVAEVTRHNYKPPAEWFKEKRPSPAQQTNRVLKVGGGSTSAPEQQQMLLNKERGQTPDWIHKIFDVARRGHLLKLQRVMTGMEPTLVRNLSDHRGNNLLHVLAGSGNADALAWLCSSFGPEMQDALLDENKRGLTPVVAAIQAGRLEALQFLVDHTSARDRLAPVDGDRCLLHIAAKYGKIDLVAWLAQYMESHGFEVDLRDHCGQTPLHLAARAGHASAVAILVAHGADVTAKNDMGHRPLDLASANGHVGVAQLLRLHDAALCLSSETLEANEELDNLRGDYAELKSYFRDVLVIGKRFAKERDEMCRQLGRLYEDVTSLHQALLFELRTLHRDLAGVRDRVSSSRKAGEIADRNLDESVAVVEALHDKWQSQQRSWFSSNLADMEHRLLMAEDGWKRLRTSTNTKHRTCQIRPHELLRSRLAAVNAQASNIQCDVTTLSSDEGSLYSGCCQSAGASSDGEEDEALVSIESGNYNNSAHFSPPAINSAATSRAAGESVAGSTAANTSTTGPPTWFKSPRSLAVAFKSRQAASGHARNGTAAADSTSGADSVYGTLHAAVRNMGHNPSEQEIKEQQQLLERSYHRKKPTPSSTRQELRKKLQEVKLTSESGNASVIEVIEPSSSEGDDHDDVLDGRTPRDQSTPLRGSNTRSFNASFSEELERARQSKRMHNNPSVANESVAAGVAAATASANANTKTLAEPDLLAGTVPVMAGSSSRSCHDLSLVQRLVDQQQLAEHQLATGDDAEITGNSTRSHSSLSSSNNTAVTSVSVPAAAGSRKKSGGFLTKFALKARWPSKRSSKSSSAESPSLLTPATSPVACGSPQTTAETESGPSDFSLGDSPSTTSPQTVHHHHHRQCEEEEESTAGTSAGVVAGLSQMFEDMSMSGMVKSPTKPNAQVAQLMAASLEKRASHSLAGPESLDGSRCKSAAAGSTAAESANQQVVMDLPPSTSPPPVPLEIETYNSMSPSSQNETSSSSVCSSGGTNVVGGMQPPPPPPRFSTNSKGSSDLSSSSSKVSSTSGGGVSGGVGVGGATPGSSSASSSTSASHGGAESLSVAASEDSGIVMARPASSASKSDSSPRHPPSSSYTFTNSSTFSPLRKATLTGSGSTSSTSTHQSLQSQADAERHGLSSPAPSDCISKAESTASGDLLLSKTESMRHFRQLARIEEQAASTTGVVTGQMVVDGHSDRKPVEHMTSTQAGQDANVEMAHQSGQILTWREAKLKNQVVTPPPLEERLNKTRVRLEEKSIRTLKKRHHHVTERPWYDVSDDESDLLTPERLTKLKTSLSSSDSPSSDSNGSHGSSSSGEEEEV